MMRPIARIAAHSAVVLAIVLTLADFNTQAADRTRSARSADYAHWISDASGRPMSFTLPSSPDNWLGGTGNWSNGADWSAGEPGGSSDVFINTGNDNVTLDVSSSINSLTIGGTSGSSTLSSQGNDLTIAGSLTVNQTGTLTFSNAFITVDGAATNAGAINLRTADAIIYAANLNNSGTIQGGGSVSATNTLTNSGSIMLESNVSGISASTVVNSGFMLGYAVSSSGNFTNQTGGVVNAQNLNVGGNLINQGTIQGLMPNSFFTVTGEVINSGRFDTSYATVTVGSMNNSGFVPIGGFLTVNGDFYNSGGINESYIGHPYSQNLTIQGTLTNTGSISLMGPEIDGLSANNIVNSGSLTLDRNAPLSTVNLTNSGTITAGAFYGGNSISIAGTLTNQAGGMFSLGGAADVANIGYVANAGTVTIANDATMHVTGGAHAPPTAIPGFLNTGVVDIAQGGSLNALTYTQTSGQSTVDGTLIGGGRGIVNFAGGSVYGNSGAMDGEIISNADFNIGDAPMSVGRLAINGNYTQGLRGSLTFDIASLNSYDQLNVSGHAQLNGLMTVDLLNGYIPQVGNMFDIMNFASESGTFSTVVGLPINNSEHFMLEYNTTNLTLDVVAGPGMQAPSSGHGSSSSNEPFITPLGDNMSFVSGADSQPAASVPEPGSILLFGSGVAGIAAFVRRTR